MKGAWGTSFGKSFGAAFGRRLDPAVITPTTSAGGGGGAAGARDYASSNAFFLHEQNQLAVSWLMATMASGVLE